LGGGFSNLCFHLCADPHPSENRRRSGLKTLLSSCNRSGKCRINRIGRRRRKTCAYIAGLFAVSPSFC
jgi:hypothetical protein